MSALIFLLGLAVGCLLSICLGLIGFAAHKDALGYGFPGVSGLIILLLLILASAVNMPELIIKPVEIVKNE